MGLGRCIGSVSHGAPARARRGALHAQPDGAASHESRPSGEGHPREGFEYARFTAALVSHDAYLFSVRGMSERRGRASIQVAMQITCRIYTVSMGTGLVKIVTISEMLSESHAPAKSLS